MFISIGSPGSPSSSPPTSVSGSVITDGTRSNLKSLDENSNAANIIGRSNIGGPPGLTSIDRRVGSISPASMDSNHGSGASHELDHSLGQSTERAAKSKLFKTFFAILETRGPKLVRSLIGNITYL